ncbi:unnamed protein product [Brachionus calyciflorus]|uniref:Uncharacterized protein n=1 Tax=Brachionus calyciflorus TaxID=104777 RepID=A0A814BM14_9BILA|nr:unnamed protein product [Brachionus calyciflorus]
MNFKLFILFFVINKAFCESETKSEDDLKSEAENGKQLVLNALNVLLNGEPEEHSYKDIFLDTSKGLLSQTSGGNDLVTIDDMIRIFIQSLIILSTSRRPDLIPQDFHVRNEYNGAFINELNTILDKLKEKGTDKVNLKDLRLLIKTVQSDGFWASISQLKKEVDREIELEAQRDDSKKNAQKQEL